MEGTTAECDLLWIASMLSLSRCMEFSTDKEREAEADTGAEAKRNKTNG